VRGQESNLVLIAYSAETSEHPILTFGTIEGRRRRSAGLGGRTAVFSGRFENQYMYERGGGGGICSSSLVVENSASAALAW